VDRAIDELHGVIRDIRNFIFGLRPALLDSGDLFDGLRALADELRRNTATDIQVAGRATAGLPLDVVAELLAIAREGLANVARHSGAQRATLSVSEGDGGLRLELKDDGRGFTPGAGAARGHHGLANMRSRAAALGGTLEVDSRPGEGTRIIVSLPAPARTD
jgi:signal transduction histidine kinase